MTTARGEGVRRAVFIIRLENNDHGRVTGIVERVRTGEKVWIDGLKGLADVLTAMLASDEGAR